MKTKGRILGSAALVLAMVIGALGWTITPGLRAPADVPEPDYWPTGGWRTAAPEEQGYSSTELMQALQKIHEKGTNIDSLLIVRHGYVVLDTYFAPYDGSFPHNLASVTKSVMTTLIAIAADQGKVDLDRPMVSYFPNRSIANLDENKALVTVRHLTGMVNGMQSGCYADDDGTLRAMRSNPDWVQAALDRPMVSAPGKQFCYDSPGMHILSAILQEATGMTALDFARQYLFEPLGIQDAVWDVDPQGHNRGWGDLYLSPGSAAKIGLLWLHKGNWNGRQIVPSDWVVASVRAHIRPVDHDYGYGYGWWINFSHYFAAGRGGQEIRVIPALDTVLVTTGGGFEIGEIEGIVTPLVLKSGWAKRPNPQGVNDLQALLAGLQRDAMIHPSTPAPATAKAISGKQYRCEDNPAGLQSVRMTFDNAEEATLYQKSFGQDLVWKIGLDGRNRFTVDGDALLGYWEDEQTFHLEIFDIGTLIFRIKFFEDRAEVTQEGVDLVIACRATAP